MNVYEALKTAIEDADRNYRENKDESYLSVFYTHKKQQLEKILSQIEQTSSLDEYFNDLQQERLRLARLSSKEAFHPSFDWYGDHYWEIVYDGEAAGCEQAIAILEPFFGAESRADLSP